MSINNEEGENPAKKQSTPPIRSGPIDRGFAKLKQLGMVKEEKVLSFEELYIKESRNLGKPVKMEKKWVSPGTGGEPWVNFTPQDRFGLALSGGGIRSATFNLGLLQSLDQLGVLKHLDYLATVSGGGYVGGFWIAWLRRNRSGNDRMKPDEKVFPVEGDQPSSESAEVRHLREFSRFLLPRFRVIGTEFWGIIMTVLGGVIPSFSSALAVLALMWFGWVFLLAGLLAEENNENRAWAMLLLVVCYFIGSELPQKKSSQGLSGRSGSRWSQYSAEHGGWDCTGYFVGVFIASMLIAVGWLVWRKGLHSAGMDSTNLSVPKMMLTLNTRGFESLKNPEVGFKPAQLIATVTLMLLIVRAMIARVFVSPGGVSWLVGFERAVTRVLRLAAIMLALATLWWIAGQLKDSGHGLRFTGIGGVFSTGLFLWARKWLSEPPTETHGGDLLGFVFGWLKRATPKVLAAITWILLFVLVGAGVEWWIQNMGTPRDLDFWWLPGGCLLLVVLMICFFDLERMGMHELYRSRISRCYLGASNTDRNVGLTAAIRAASNRSTSEQAHDDITFGELAGREGTIRPMHLICTTANDLSGDVVGTLYRGAKSAVLSVNGISLGDKTAKVDQLRLSSALTSSAAAFNSQMGRYSIDLGPAVTFLMTALNLRLGLWVPHPDNCRRWRITLPGRFFFFELFGWSNADGGHLLLSDGGHFENFGLYELVRRHCRYIIVSDCGSDPETAFDDLANVLRRVREDFGVEVELDVSPLKPGEEGLASQHAAVGTIHYNGLGGMDKGTLIFLKPTLSGDEPPDVLQYRARNNTFPQESTANQFYAEPQWESYRRLGEHSGRIVFAFLDRPATETSDTVDNIFREARSFWYPMPENLNDSFTEMSARCAELEESLTTDGPSMLRREFFSEAAELLQPKKAKGHDAGDQPQPKPAPEVDEEIKVLGFLIRIIQMMEDIWVSANFECYWSHPLNEGWMTYFHRWAGTPSFRRWWPVLAPMYSVGFRTFVQEHFAVGTVDPEALQPNRQVPTAARLHLSQLDERMDYRDSNAWRCFLQYHPCVKATLAGKIIFGYALQLLTRQGVPAGPDMWVGFVLVRETRAEADIIAEWISEEFFVPPMLHGGKFVSNLLDAVIRHYQVQTDPTKVRLVVKLKQSTDDEPQVSSKTSAPRKSQGLAPAARYNRVREIEFYKSRRFQYRQPENPTSGVISLYLDLEAK